MIWPPQNTGIFELKMPCCECLSAFFFGWGINDSGHLGVGDTSPHYDPTEIPLDGDVVSVLSSGNYTIALLADGTLWSTGANNVGQLGLGDTTDRSSFTQVGSDSDWVAIGVPGFGNFTVAIKADGTLWAWGLNDTGQLGLGDTTDRDSPVQVGSDTDWAFVFPAAGFTLAIKNDGTLWAWGLNNHGQLGLGDTTDRNSPVQVGSDTWTKASVGSYGESFVTGIKTDGTLWGWGSNPRGNLGVGDTTEKHSPTLASSNTTWTKIYAVASAVGAWSFAIRSDGTLWGCGSDGSFLGLGGTDPGTPVTSYTQIGSDSWVAFRPSPNGATIGIRDDGTLWAWGYNLFGQLGFGGGPDEISSPAQIGTDTDWVRIAVDQLGESIFICAFAIKSNGTMWSWGININGTLGLGPSAGTFIDVPTQIGVDVDWSNVINESSSTNTRAGVTFAIKAIPS